MSKRKLFFLIFALLVTINCSERIIKRNKRYLIWPRGFNKVQFLVGAGFPVDLDDYAAIVGVVLKAAYQIPSNSSYILNPKIPEVKRKRSTSRWNIYNILAQLSNLYGYNGKSCILRIICEIANVPIERNNGLINEIVHAIFTPMSTYESLDEYFDNEYYAAHKLGKRIDTHCDKEFKDCRVSFVEMFSKLGHEN